MKALMLLANQVAANPRLFWSSNRNRYEGLALTPVNGWAGRYQAGEFLSVRPEWLREMLEKHEIDWDNIKGAWRELGWLRLPSGKRAQALTVSERIDGSNAMCVKIICPELLDALVTGMVD
jgi:hypothetical protein